MDKTEIVISAVDQTKSAFQSVQSGLGGLEGALRGIDGIADRIPMIGAALTAAFGAGTITQSVGAMIQMADELNDMSQRTGIAVEKLGAYKLAADQSGASLGAVATGVKGLSNTILAHGDDLKKLGIETQDTDKAFRQLADVFKDMPDGMEKSALAVKLFGRSGQELIPLLNQGSEGLERSAAASADYAKAMADLAPDADKLNDQMAQLRMMADAFSTRLALAVVPNLNAAASAFIAAEQAGTGFFRAMAESALAGVGGIFYGVKGPEETILGLTKELAAAQEVLKVPDQTTATIELYTQRVDELTKKLKAMNALNPDLKLDGRQADVRTLDNELIKRGLRKIYDDRGKAAKVKTDIDEIGQLLDKLATKSDGFNDGYLKSLSLLSTGFSSGRIPLQQYVEAMFQLNQQQPVFRKAVEAAKKAEDDWVKGVEKGNEAVAKQIESLVDRAVAAELELETYGKTKSEIESVILARLEEQHAMVSGWDSQEQLTENLEKEIAARKRLRDAMRSTEVKDAAVQQAKDAEERWKRAAEQIGQSLTDEIMRGGKNAGELLKDYFRTLVLRPMIEGGVQMGMQAVGLGGGPANGVNLLSNGTSMWSAVTGGTSYIAGQFAMSGMGQSLGLSSATAIPGMFVGDTLGAAGASLTGAGSSLVAAAPYIAAAVALASLMNSPGGGPKSIVGGGDLDSTFAADRNADLNTIVAGIKTDYAAIVTSFGQQPGALSAALIGESDPSGTAADFTRYRVRVGDQERFDMQEFGRGDWQKNTQGIAAKALLAALEATQINEVVDRYLDAIDIPELAAETATDMLATVRAAGALTEPLPDLMAQVRDLGLSAFSAWQQGGDSLRDMIANLDGSAASMQTLGALMQSRYAQELQLVRQIQDAMSGTTDMFAASIRDIQLSVLDSPARYEFFDKEAARYRDLLSSVTDPELVSQYATKLNNAIQSGWGVLDEDQKKAKASEFVAILEQADALAQDRYLASQEAVMAERREEAAVLATQLADVMATASSQLSQAIATPQQVHVAVTVEGSPASAEVAYGGVG